MCFKLWNQGQQLPSPNVISTAKGKRKKGTTNERPHTNGIESSAETTIDDIQIAKPTDVLYTRAEYDFSESSCTRIVLTS
jgi:hypothetical protein